LATFIAGDVVVVPFPYSDLSNSKRRPALVVARLTGDDVILCQITSQTIRDDYAITIVDADFSEGSLKTTSNIRPNRIFTADKNIILYKVGRLKPNALKKVGDQVISILSS